MSKVHYLTAEGLEKIKAELAHMIYVERPAISKQIGEARDTGDLPENAEYDAAREAQGMLELKISQLQDLVANARVIDESKINTDHIQMLNRGKIKNLATKAIMEFTLVGESEANIKEGKLAAATPIGKALIGKKKGEIVEVQAPGGRIKFEIIDMSM